LKFNFPILKEEEHNTFGSWLIFSTPCRVMPEEQVVFQVSAHPRWSQGKLAAGMPHCKSVIECLKAGKKI